MEMITPSLKLKTNELFFKWFTESDRSEQLKEIIQLIKTNKITKINDLQSCFKVSCCTPSLLITPTIKICNLKG